MPKKTSSSRPSPPSSSEAAGINTTQELETIEDFIRSEEETVLKELDQDKGQNQELQDISRQCLEIFADYDAGDALLGRFGHKLNEVVKSTTVGDAHREEAKRLLRELTKISITLSRMATTRSQIEHELQISMELADSLSEVGNVRDCGIVHALQGLANTKAQRAEGQAPRAEVFDRLRAVTAEAQGMSVSHTNMRVRQSHSLKLIKRLMRSLEEVRNRHELEESIAAFLATVPLQQHALTADPHADTRPANTSLADSPAS